MPENTQWSVLGGGTISPTNGSSTIFTAPKSPETSTVHAKIGGQELTQDFGVVAPSSITVITNLDTPLGTAVTNGTAMGAETHFSIVIGSTNVSFNNVSFRESLPTLNVTWPNGTNASIYISNTNIISINCNHKAADDIEDGPYATGLLFNGTNYVNFSYTYTWSYQYLNEAGVWTNFATPSTTTEYNGGNKQCRETYQGVHGGWQGPY